MRYRKFDFIFGLGAACSCSRMLRERKLQLASLPLDWVGDPCMEASANLRLTTDIVIGHFENWFERDNLVRAPNYDSDKHVGYYDKGTKLFFTHDFSPSDNILACYPAVREKYARRISRFHRLLTSSRRVLIVWVADPRGCGEVCESDLKECINKFRAAYPNIDFMLLAANCSPGIAPESARVIRGDGYECYSFDYRVVTTGEPTWDVRTELFAPLFGRYKVIDYRTRAEKRANAKREKARAYEKFKATSVLDFLLTKLQFKIYRHLERRLTKKGILQQSPLTK